MKIRTAALAVLLLFALTGCSAAEPPVEIASETPAVESEAPASESPAPLVAETVDPVERTQEQSEALFIEKFYEIRATMPGETVIPNATDAQLLAAAREGCDRMDAGESSDTISLIEGEEKNGADYYSDTGAILTAARQSICPAP